MKWLVDLLLVLLALVVLVVGCKRGGGIIEYGNTLIALLLLMLVFLARYDQLRSFILRFTRFRVRSRRRAKSSSK